VAVAGAAMLTGLVVAPSAAAKVVTSVSLTSPTSGEYSSIVTMTGTLWRNGTTVKIPGAKVYLQRATHRKTNWTNVTTTTTNAAGQFRFTVTLWTAYDYRAYYKGSTAYTGALSPVRYPAVLQRVRLGSIDSTYGLHVTGSVFPLTPPCPVGTCKRYIYLQRYNPTTRTWVNLFSGPRVVQTWFFDFGGTAGPGVNQLYRLYVPIMYPYAHGYSPTFRYTHYTSRPMFAKASSASHPGSLGSTPVASASPPAPTVTRGPTSAPPAAGA
jgi:hypothetical protein